MKKKGLLLVVVFAIFALISPLQVFAQSNVVFGATGSLSSDSTQTTLSSDETSSTGTFTITGSTTRFYIGVRAWQSIPVGTTVNVDIQFANSNFAYSSCTKQTGWSVTCTQDTEDSSIVHMTLVSTGEMTSGDKALAASVTITKDSAVTSSDTCVITISVPNDSTTTTTTTNPTCTIEDKVYYCADGDECTADEYEEQCTTTENPTTGSFLPYAVIGVGVIIAAGMYMYTKKNKIYHI